MPAFLSRAGHVGTLSLTSPEIPGVQKETGIQYTPHCLYSLGAVSHSYQVEKVGTLLKSMFPDTSQGPHLQACHPKESSSGLPRNSFLHTVLYINTCSIFKWPHFSLLHEQYLCLVRKMYKTQTAKGRNFKINFDIIIQR